MWDNNLQEKLSKAIYISDYEAVIELLKQGAEVTKDMVLVAESKLSDLEQELYDDKALYAGRTAKNSYEDYTYRIVSRYAKGQKLDYIINSMFNKKVSLSKSKGEIIKPKNKAELSKLIKKKRQYLGDIDISNIKDLSYLFEPTEKKVWDVDEFINEPVQRTDFGGIEKWDTSHVEDMSYMFCSFDFTQIPEDSPLFKWISNLNTSNVINMNGMFAKSQGFNTDISKWNVSKVKYMGHTFYNAENFNQDLSKWNTSNVEFMVSIFDGAKSFDQNIDNWDTSSINKNYEIIEKPEGHFHNNYRLVDSVEDKQEFEYNLFKDCPTKPKWLKIIEKEDGSYRPKTKLELILLVRNKDISLYDIDISAIKDLSSLFAYMQRNYDGIDTWDVSHVTNMSYMFYHSDFNNDISMWNTSKVQNMEYMFYGAKSFNQNINNWNVSNITNMAYMFSGAVAFNQPLDNWDISNVKTMKGMFRGAKEFNQNINSWNTSNVKDMSSLFNYALKFNQPLDNWNTSKVTKIQEIFSNADSFNQNINNWNVSKVTNFKDMFYGTANFNQPLNNWNVSKAQNMERMFGSTEAFNQPLDNWNVSNVTNMDSMFSYTVSFNQDLSNWKPNKVKKLDFFLKNAQAFRHSLDSWEIKHPVSTYMMVYVDERYYKKIPKPKWAK